MTTSFNGVLVWFTGLSGAGKSTIASRVFEHLVSHGIKSEVLDGDVVRRHISRGLGFSREDREENNRRIGFVADLLARNGVVVLVSAISPYRAIRDEIRHKSSASFVEVYVSAPLDVCEQRDPKGLYRRARAGELRQVTGLDDPYEPPLGPEVTCPTHEEPVEESVDRVLSTLWPLLSSRSAG